MARFNELTNKPHPVLVDFHATWCGPCKMMEPILKELKHKMGDKISIIKIDVDRNQQLAGSLGVRSVPTLMIYKGGKPVWTEPGVHQVSELERVVNSYL